MSGARVYLFDVPSWELVDGDLPIEENPELSLELSEAKGFQFNLDRSAWNLYDENTGERRIKVWGSAVVVENRREVHVFLVDGLAPAGEFGEITVSAGGVASYAKDQPWLVADQRTSNALEGTPGYRSTSGLRDIYAIGVDPADLFRGIWTMLTEAPRANLRLTVDDTETNETVGTEPVENDFETGDGERVQFESGPYRITSDSDHDMGRELAALADEGPFEWVEESTWPVGEHAPRTRLRIGYPELPSTRRRNLRFELGLNVSAVSEVEWRDHADVALVLGEGEGQSRIRSHMSEATDRLRRVDVEADKSIRTQSRAREKARRILEDSLKDPLIDECTVQDSAMAPFGSFGLGDIIAVQGDLGWADLDRDYRITAITETLGDDEMQLTLEEV